LYCHDDLNDDLKVFFFTPREMEKATLTPTADPPLPSHVSLQVLSQRHSVIRNQQP